MRQRHLQAPQGKVEVSCMLPESDAVVLLASVNKLVVVRCPQLTPFSWLALSSLTLVAVRHAARALSRRVLRRWGAAAAKRLNLKQNSAWVDSQVMICTRCHRKQREHKYVSVIEYWIYMSGMSTEVKTSGLTTSASLLLFTDR